MQLKEARVIVTGASSGIGRAIALEFARRGARVALAARSEQALHELATEIRGQGGEAIVIPSDVTIAAEVERMAKETIRALGGIDVLLNNAGVGLNATIADASGSDVEALFRLNVLAAADVIRAVIPIMRAQRRGMIVNISSVAGRIVVGTGVLDTGRLRVYVQSGDAAIYIAGSRRALNPPLHEGDSIAAEGAACGEGRAAVSTDW